MNTTPSSLYPKPVSGDCRELSPAAAALEPRAPARLLGGGIARSRNSDAPFKPRDPRAQRKLLVAAP